MAERSTSAGGGELVGRARELRVLLSGVDNAIQGVPVLVVLNGPAGSGRTALLDTGVRAAAGHGATVLRATCSPAGSHRPFHAVATLLGVDPEDPAAAAPVSQRLAGRLASLTRAGPVVIALDDAHWCDEASVAWLDQVVRRGSGLPLLVMAARRTSAEPAPAAAAFGAAASRAWPVELSPLSEQDIAVLAGRAFGIRPDPAFIRACALGSRGSPALALRLFDRLAGIEPVEARAVAAAEAAREVFAESVSAALDREPGYVRRVAEAVAVLGSADREPVAMLAGVPGRLAAAALDLLRSAGIVADGDHADGDLTDERVRAAVLAGVVPAELPARRRRAARVLNDGGAAPELVGLQLSELDELDERWMRPALRVAADAATAANRPREAVRFLRRLLDDDPDDVGLLLRFAGTAQEFDPGAAYAALRGGLERVRDPADRARLAARLGRVSVVLGRAAETAAVLDRVAGEAGPDGPGTELVTARRLVALWSGSPAPDARAGDPPVDREALALRALAQAGAGDPEAVRTARRALDGPPVTGWAFAAAGYVLSLTDEPGEALGSLAGVEHAPPWTRAVGLALRALVRVLAGELAGARADATAALEPVPAPVAAEPAVMARTALALVCCRQGAADDAGRLLGGVGDGPALTRPHLLITRAALAELRGATGEALDLLTACAALPGGVLVPWWLEAARLRGPGDEARDLVAIGRDLATRWGTATARGLALLGRGIAEDDLGTRTAALADAVETLAGAPWYLARARILLAGARVLAEDRAGARKHFRAAVDLAARCGFRPLADQARAGLVAAGGRLHARAAGVLTDGERRVAELAARGATNREIAEALLVALRTVEIHLTSVYRKLGVSGRGQLAAALAGR